MITGEIKKKLILIRNFDSNFVNKIDHVIVKEPFPQKNIPWENQAVQREYIFKGLKNIEESDLVMFSDPDEIPNSDLKNLILNKKYGIFMQDMFTLIFNIFNKFESPWEGTRICKKKNLKSIDWLRQKVVTKNLNRFNQKEKYFTCRKWWLAF